MFCAFSEAVKLAGTATTWEVYKFRIGGCDEKD